MKILLIDDNLSLTTVLGRALQLLNYKTRAENRAMHAMETVKSFQPDLIILDLEMPEKSGLEIYGELQLSDQFSTIPVIMLAPLDKQGAVRAEVFHCDVIGKPAPFGELCAAIERNLFPSDHENKNRDLHPSLPTTSQKREFYEKILR